MYTFERSLYLNYLAHHGILGMRWGVRRYQNEDGSLTPAGKIRYSNGDSRDTFSNRSTDKKINKIVERRNLNTAKLNSRYERGMIDEAKFKKKLSNLDYVTKWQVSQELVIKNKSAVNKAVELLSVFAFGPIAAIPISAINADSVRKLMKSNDFEELFEKELNF